MGMITDYGENLVLDLQQDCEKQKKQNYDNPWAEMLKIVTKTTDFGRILPCQRQQLKCVQSTLAETLDATAPTVLMVGGIFLVVVYMQYVSLLSLYMFSF